MADDSITALRDRVLELLTYNPSTGEFVWRVGRRGRARVHTLAGATGRRGYVKIRVDGKRYRAHHLAWLIHHGALPTHQIDHINGNPSDNRISNLRDVPQIVNCENRKGSPSFDKQRGMWVVKVVKNRRLMHYERCLSFAEAVVQKHEAKKRHHPGYAR